jgi:hypothetical protein
MLYSKLKQLPFSETVEPPYINIGTAIIAVVGAAILTRIYKQYFIKKSQGKLKEIRAQLRDIKLFIYKNLSTNGDFLKAVVQNDLNAMLSLFNAEINKNNRNNCTSPTSNCDAEVQKMVFTISLFSYFNDQIPESDPNYETMKQIFTLDNIQKRTIDPSLYFYYKQPIYIPDMFSTFQDINEKPFFTDSSREHVFHTGLTILFQTCNKKLANLQMISDGKNKIASYIVIFLCIIILFICIFCGIYYSEIKGVLIWIRDYVKSKLANKVKATSTIEASS